MRLISAHDAEAASPRGQTFFPAEVVNDHVDLTTSDLALFHILVFGR